MINLSNYKYIFGPCSFESLDQTKDTFLKIRDQFDGMFLFRAGSWKPRTRPGGFEGVGELALECMNTLHKSFIGFDWGTEVATPEQVTLALKYNPSFLWIGARTTSDPFAIEALAKALQNVEIPILVKNPIAQDIGLWTGAIERLLRWNCCNIGLIFRGVTANSYSMYRNEPVWDMALEMQNKFPDCPMFIDPSHIAGKKDLLHQVLIAAKQCGFNRFMIESHNNPSCAITDAKQQISPSELYDLIYNINNSDTESLSRIINELRKDIKITDINIFKLLHERFTIAKEIAKNKKVLSADIEQPGQKDIVRQRYIEFAETYGMDEEFADDLFELIHKYSCKVQLEETE